MEEEANTAALVKSAQNCLYTGIAGPSTRGTPYDTEIWAPFQDVIHESSHINAFSSFPFHSEISSVGSGIHHEMMMEHQSIILQSSNPLE